MIEWGQSNKLDPSVNYWGHLKLPKAGEQRIDTKVKNKKSIYVFF